MSTSTLNLLIGFGGVAVIGIAAMVAHWLLGRAERRERHGSASRPASADGDRTTH